MNRKDPFRPQLSEDSDSPPVKGFKERLYDRVKLPLWALDIFIALLILALVLVIIIGTRS